MEGKQPAPAVKLGKGIEWCGQMFHLLQMRKFCPGLK